MGKDFLTSLRPALVMTVLFALLLGLAYPLALTGIGQMLFPAQANGSIVMQDGQAIGSSIVGQGFASDRYFHSRPSAAGKGYDGMASSGSNLGPTSQALADRVKADVAALPASTPSERPDRHVPPDLLTTSASGLDPDLSPEAAFYQVDRVARARSLSPATVRALVAQGVEQPLLGFLGEPRVNVFDLNRRLDRISATSAR
ncbi:potassium-transporting ATPase subunit KdpC [Sphingobium sp. H39-3-25]|uniref:potassium-transporting ATPase subunit KdpC n=1 Tax=Sphingobium arseniciresistens TaxID=3030834 RepID=UPI0023B8908B|nr:potassium-transporting ATPase subunit KdpC [Sphingobium arseniciresistens]